MNDEYFAQTKLIEQFDQNRQFQEVLLLSLKTISLVPDYVKQEVKEHGVIAIEKILPIKYACAYLPVLHRRSDLQDIRNLIKPITELEKWVSMIDHALALEELWIKIEHLIQTNPGVRQSEVKEILGLDVHDVVDILFRADQLGIVKRESLVNTYKLYLVKDAQMAINDAILKLNKQALKIKDNSGGSINGSSPLAAKEFKAEPKKASVAVHAEPSNANNISDKDGMKQGAENPYILALKKAIEDFKKKT